MCEKNNLRNYRTMFLGKENEAFMSSRFIRSSPHFLSLSHARTQARAPAVTSIKVCTKPHHLQIIWFLLCSRRTSNFIRLNHFAHMRSVILLLDSQFHGTDLKSCFIYSYIRPRPISHNCNKSTEY
jgi:hypothetical protein